MVTDIELYTSEEKEKLNKSSTVFYVETQNEVKKTDNKSIKISTCGDKNESSKEENSGITRPVSSVQRTLWKETDEVIKQGILDGMSKCEVALHESKYEILTSEVSYLKSLTILVAVFIESPELTEILSEDDKDDLFRHVVKVKEASEKFLYDLAGHWEEDVLMKNVYTVIDRHIDSTFSVYIDYCSNQICLHRTLQRLLLQDNKFLEVTKELENSPECLGYSLDSFLTLPMQRVTRLPLLMQAVQRRLPNDAEELEVCNRVVNSLCQLVKECNESVRRMEENYEKSCVKKKMSLDLSSKVISPKKSVKKEKSSNSRRWSWFTVREVKTTS